MSSGLHTSGCTTPCLCLPGVLPQQWRQLMPMSFEGIAVLLAKDVMKPVPPADMKARFFSPYIIVPKKNGGLRPTLGPCILNWAFHKPPFKMLMQKRIFGCIRPRDRSASVDLKDPYYHVSIFPRHRSVLRFAFEGRAYQYKVLPSGACRNSPATSSSGVRSIWGCFAPFTFQACSTGQPRRLHPQTVQLIWRHFGLAQADLFASPETSHCQLFYSLTEGTLGTDALAHSWPRGLCKYAFPPVSLLAQTLCKIREDEEQILLVAPYWPTRTLCRQPLLGRFLRGRIYSEMGHLVAPTSRPVETSCLVPWRDAEVLGDLPQEVVDNITSAGAPSTRHLRLEMEPDRQMVLSSQRRPPEVPDQSRAVLLAASVGAKAVSLHPQSLRRLRLLPTTSPWKGSRVGKHDWVIRFLRGGRLNPLRPSPLYPPATCL